MKAIDWTKTRTLDEINHWEKRMTYYRESIKQAADRGCASELISYAAEVKKCEDMIQACKEKLEMIEAIEYDINKFGK